jgi:hypothetical protein
MGGMAMVENEETRICEAVRREREEIVKMLTDHLDKNHGFPSDDMGWNMWRRGWRDAAEWIRARGEKKPGMIARISKEDWADGRELLWRTMNELIDAVNEMRGKA